MRVPTRWRFFAVLFAISFLSYLMRQNIPNSELASKLGISPYAATHVNEKARKVPEERLVSGIKRIAETDAALKTSLATPRLQLELLICELCPGR